MAARPSYRSRRAAMGAEPTDAELRRLLKGA
jgi:hypothetical protein